MTDPDIEIVKDALDALSYTLDGKSELAVEPLNRYVARAEALADAVEYWIAGGVDYHCGENALSNFRSTEKNP